MLPQAIAVVLGLALAQQVHAQKCTSVAQCPESLPCCSEYGWCGTGSYCLNGCNPMASFSLGSCKPNPICKDTQYTFNDDSRILKDATTYDGDVAKYDWVLGGGQVASQNGDLVMQLTKENNGVLVSSTRYIQYGTITAKMKVSKWQGVVTGFITMSDIHDEIDWEWPGSKTTEAQINYFWQGALFNSGSHGYTQKGLTDTHDNYHDYTIDWQPDSMKFLIDNKLVHEVKKSDTLKNSIYMFPSTPARIQLSLWPAGTTQSAPGTIQWAGGLINWNDPDYTADGHFEASVKSISVKCGGDTPPSGSTGYTYGKNATANIPTIGFSKDSPVVPVSSAKSSSSSPSTAKSTGTKIVTSTGGAITSTSTGQGGGQPTLTTSTYTITSSTTDTDFPVSEPTGWPEDGGDTDGGWHYTGHGWQHTRHWSHSGHHTTLGHDGNHGGGGKDDDDHGYGWGQGSNGSGWGKNGDGNGNGNGGGKNGGKGDDDDKNHGGFGGHSHGEDHNNAGDDSPVTTRLQDIAPLGVKVGINVSMSDGAAIGAPTGVVEPDSADASSVLSALSEAEATATGPTSTGKDKSSPTQDPNAAIHLDFDLQPFAIMLLATLLFMV